jgi:hypothetical protein
MNHYELTYNIVEFDVVMGGNVSKNTIIPFMADNDHEAKRKVKGVLYTDARYRKGDYNTLHQIIRQEIL